MGTMEQSFFAWNLRRVVLRDEYRPREWTADRTVVHIDLDVSLTVGARRARLITFGEDGDDYMVLVVGAASGQHDVPVSAVDAEALLIRGSQSLQDVEILVVLPSMLTGDPRTARHELDSQLCTGGPIRQILGSTDVVSVVVEWCSASQMAA